jgi:putative oxidoreductase
MDFGLLVLRMTVGLTLAAHGAQKLFGWFGGHGPAGTAVVLETLGFRPGRPHAYMAGGVEAVGGVLLVLGFLTPVGAALTISVMVVAAVSAHVKQGFFLTDGRYEYTLMIGAVALSVAFTGPGAFSLDHALSLRCAGTVYGIGALAIAAMGAVAQLAGRELTVASPVHS